jgi:poly(hydroxyalkanoate) depolymerase family esterase
LHGCNQDPDDFAAGTGMNRLGGAQNFFVLYPEQSRDANPSRCWNWFSPENQQRDSGEPDFLAGMTLAVITAYKIDPQRVYLAGMSAGGAMAAIVAAAYPEIFAAVGIHSGLTPGAASNVLEALGVMKSGTARGDGRRHSPRPPARQRLGKVATGNVLRTPRAIVFQGDADRTVHPRNGEQVVADLLERIDGSGTLADAAPARVEQGTSAHGRHYTRSSYADADDRVVAEYWLVHGSGHAWSGGLDAGSYTDASGPDASGEMVRFFFDHPNAGAPA